MILYQRKSCSDTLIILSCDSHLCSPEYLDLAENQDHITGLSGNQVRNKLAQTTIENAKRRFKVHKKFKPHLSIGRHP